MILRPVTDPRPDVLQFVPSLLRLQASAPSPLPRAVIRIASVFLVAVLAWAVLARLDVVAVATGRIIPSAFVQTVQPAEGGVVREVLVREGERVQAGQPLVRMERRASDAEFQALRVRHDERRLELRGLDAELAGGAFASRADDDQALFERARVHLAARRQAHADAMQAERSAAARSDSDRVAADAQRARLRDTVPLLAEQADAWSQLVAEGFAGRLQAQERVRLHLEGARELEAATASADAAAAAAVQARQRLAQRESEHRQQLLTLRAEAQSDLDRLAAELRKQDVRRELLVLHAPRAGVVKDIATHSIGAVVQPATVLLSLVPTDAPLEAEVHVTDNDAGFVREGQSVRVKIGAFAFQRYGMVGGTVRHVGPDAVEPRVAGARGDDGTSAGGYRAFIALDREALDHEGRRLPLVAGMLVAAEVQLGTRSVLDYVLSPVAKTVMEAGRER